MALQANLYDFEGKTTSKISLPKELFAASVSSSLIAQSVRAYLSNQRKAKAHARTRGEVTGSTRKIYRQKGTGRARHGDIKAPIFVGGGKSHGPTGEQNYQMRLSKKMRKEALVGALTAKFKAGEIIFIEGWEKLTGRTKEADKILRGWTKLAPGKGKTLLVLPGKLEKLVRSVRNIKGVTLVQLKNLSAYQVLNGGIILFPREALKISDEKNRS